MSESMASPSSPNFDPQNNPSLKEYNYMGLSDCSSVDSSTVSGVTDENKGNSNLKATELRLGLPGSHSPDRDSEISLPNLNEKQLFPLLPSKDKICSNLSPQAVIVSGNKRGFNVLSKKTEIPAQFSEEYNDVRNNGSNINSPPTAKAQVVGWPPIRSFRKNSLATNSKKNEEVDGKLVPGALFVKVSMDGAPYLRKVDLRSYTAYHELSMALEKMFTCFTIGQCGPQGTATREMTSEGKLRDLLHGSEYVLTYEDKDGDWMLVGDVPWEMFIGSCKRLKIMKGSDAIGLAPKAAEKSQNQN